LFFLDVYFLVYYKALSPLRRECRCQEEKNQNPKIKPHTTTNPQQIKEKQKKNHSRTTSCLENTPIRQGPCSWKTITTEKTPNMSPTQAVVMDTNHKKSQNITVPSKKKGTPPSPTNKNKSQNIKNVTVPPRKRGRPPSPTIKNKSQNFKNVTVRWGRRVSPTIKNKSNILEVSFETWIYCWNECFALIFSNRFLYLTFFVVEAENRSFCDNENLLWQNLFVYSYTRTRAYVFTLWMSKIYKNVMFLGFLYLFFHVLLWFMLGVNS